MELEVFVHGALCVSYSGQCFLSSMLGGRSGNRGRCAQPCRKLYLSEMGSSYFLSPKDLCVLELIPDLMEAGIDLDFEAVFRELNGLDSILQAGGRSNREGKREKGFVFIFERDNDKVSKEIRINTTKKLLETYGDITSKECIEQYYNEIFFFNEKIRTKSLAQISV